MSGLALATWAAIAVLIAGSLAVFAWFLADVRAVFRGSGKGSEDDPPEGEPTGDG